MCALARSLVSRWFPFALGFVLHIFPQLYRSRIIIPFTVSAIGPVGHQTCIIDRSQRRQLYLPIVPLFLFESLLCGLEMAQGVNKWRSSGPSFYTSGRRLLDVLLRDSIIYFIWWGLQIFLRINSLLTLVNSSQSIATSLLMFLLAMLLAPVRIKWTCCFLATLMGVLDRSLENLFCIYQLLPKHDGIAPYPQHSGYRKGGNWQQSRGP